MGRAHNLSTAFPTSKGSGHAPGGIADRLRTVVGIQRRSLQGVSSGRFLLEVDQCVAQCSQLFGGARARSLTTRPVPFAALVVNAEIVATTDSRF